MPGYDLSNWWGIFVPKGTPDAVVDVLFKASNEVLAQEDVRAGLASGYEEATPSQSIAAFDAFARKEGAKGLSLARESTKTVN